MKEEKLDLATAYYAAEEACGHLTIVWRYMQQNPDIFTKFEKDFFENAWSHIAAAHSDLKGRYQDSLTDSEQTH